MMGLKRSQLKNKTGEKHKIFKDGENRIIIECQTEKQRDGMIKGLEQALKMFNMM